MASRPSIEAEVTLLSTTAGGRSSELALDHAGSFYRPHLLVEDPGQRATIGADGSGTEKYLGVQFRSADLRLLPGASAKVWMDLMNHPSVDYRGLVPGATFTIREGAKVVGFGKVLQRKDAI